ncbi:unnamed protein product [Macrosiphum euphorbiae]|uniref:Uncharacterized protein n=1 Tax=Macrosiphum euphorbiae TaxID=13131 RepID=A0AAV0X1C7_9HEMI|nr:unnamed protein product [Macrosiphum euphorbiae]
MALKDIVIRKRSENHVERQPENPNKSAGNLARVHPGSTSVPLEGCRRRPRTKITLFERKLRNFLISKCTLLRLKKNLLGSNPNRPGLNNSEKRKVAPQQQLQ